MSLVTDLFGRLRKEIQLVAKAINELFLSGPQPICIAGGRTPLSFRWAPYSVRTFLVGFST